MVSSRLRFSAAASLPSPGPCSLPSIPTVALPKAPCHSLCACLALGLSSQHTKQGPISGLCCLAQSKNKKGHQIAFWGQNLPTLPTRLHSRQVIPERMGTACICTICPRAQHASLSARCRHCLPSLLIFNKRHTENPRSAVCMYMCIKFLWHCLCV